MDRAPLADADAAMRDAERRAEARARTLKAWGAEKIADVILEEEGERFAQDAGGQLYHYAGGYYAKGAAEFIRGRVKEIARAYRAKWSPQLANNTVEYIRVDAPELPSEPNIDVLNVRNGLLFLDSMKLLPHSPEFLITTQIPAEYDPGAFPEHWWRFINATFPTDCQLLAWEIAAWLLTPDTSIQRAILLHGAGRNGKSRYLAALEALIGGQNVSNVPLHSLEGNRFASYRLMGKLANICGDLPAHELRGSSTLKSVTGGDAIEMEIKHGPSFSHRPTARFVFSSNHLPRSADATEAFFRRWLVVPFRARFEGSGEVPPRVLDARLADPRELSGALNEALRVLHELRAYGFSESPSTRGALAEFRGQTDPVAVWLADVTESGGSLYVPRDALHRRFNEHAERIGVPLMTKQAFNDAVKAAYPHVSAAQRRVAGDPQWCWLGIGFGEAAELDDGQRLA